VSFDVQIAYSVDEIGQEAWDHLGRDQPFASYRWYRFGERAMAYAKPIYVVLSRSGEPVARGTFWLTGRELLPIASSRFLYYGLTFLLRRWPLLMCQSPLASAATSGLVLPAPPMRDEAFRALADVGRSLLREQRASFCIFPYLERCEARWPGWPAAFVQTTIPEPGTRLAIDWSDFEGYLGHLSKKRRYNIRRNFRLAAEEGIEISCHREVLDVDEAMRLHQNVNERHKSATEPWMRGAMQHAGMVDAAWLAARVGGRLVGCELLLGDRGHWFVTGLGLDYSIEYVYFLLGYSDIQYAIERHARVLRWGSLTYDVKRRMGFEMETNNNLVFTGRGDWARRFGGWLAQRESVQAASA